ncbi:hypothetical protein [Psychroserpens mesophilus]|uniref:hypothetical protein n=1 Tax=Psychroserpens mesophilus TaxID=325473 RepID=UPI00058D005A|nr:hypothetical protein [Psychroserpens mesophilus]
MKLIFNDDKKFPYIDLDQTVGDIHIDINGVFIEFISNPFIKTVSLVDFMYADFKKFDNSIFVPWSEIHMITNQPIEE